MPQPPPPAPGGGAVPNFRKKRAGKGKARTNEDEYSSGRQQPLQKPPDQEKLTEQELKEEFVQNLNSADPLKSRNLARWDYQERFFVPYVEPEGIIILFQMDSELLGRDGRDIAETKAELIDDISDKETEDAVEKDGPKGKAPPLAPTLQKKEDGAEEPKDAKAGAKERAREEEPAPDEEKKEETEAAPTTAPSKPKKLLNQLNFCERACQTATNWPRDYGFQTEEPVRSQFKDQCKQWVIYDAYAADHDNRPKETKVKGEGAEEPEEGAAGAEEKKAAIKDMKKDKELGRLIEREKVNARKQSILDGQAAVDASLLRSSEVLKILERLAASNAHDGALMDFKYFEDISGDYREKGEGTLLPLWRFVYEKAKKKHVTSISWSVTQPDMFAVSCGSFSFIHPVANGLVVVYSLRNTNFPEHIWMGPKGAMSCHIHSERNCLTCIGLVDGNVAVLNLEKDENNEMTSQVLRTVPFQFKHSPVWSVKWGQDDIDGNPVFYSGGMDGRVLQWTLDVPDLQGLGGLIGAEIATLTLPIPPVSGPDGTLFNLFGCCARVLAFHPVEKTNFLVCTAERKIFRTSSLYGGRGVQQIYDAHFLPVENCANPPEMLIDELCTEPKTMTQRDFKKFIKSCNLYKDKVMTKSLIENFAILFVFLLALLPSVLANGKETTINVGQNFKSEDHFKDALICIFVLTLLTGLEALIYWSTQDEPLIIRLLSVGYLPAIGTLLLFILSVSMFGAGVVFVGTMSFCLLIFAISRIYFRRHPPNIHQE